MTALYVRVCLSWHSWQNALEGTQRSLRIIRSSQNLLWAQTMTLRVKEKPPRRVDIVQELIFYPVTHH